MNERIFELAIKAREYAESKPHIYQVAYDKKFAELIVQECIKQAHSVGDLRGVNDDMTFGAYTAARKISKHFGVE